MEYELPTDGELSSLTRLGEDLYEAEAEVLRLEAKLKIAKQKLDRICMTEIPEAMEEIGVLEIRTTKSHITLKPILVVQPKAADRPRVFQAVEEAGDGAIIKETVSVVLGKGQADKAKEIIEALQKDGWQAKQDRKIEPMTLKKYIKDKLEKGEAVDMELFGVKQFKQAIFKDGAPPAPVFEDE